MGVFRSRSAQALALSLALLSASSVFAQGDAKDQAKSRRNLPASSGPAPEAMSLQRLKVAKGFRVELVHAVPRETEGSWVSMTVDPKGRLYVSDQYGKLYRVTPSKPGAPMTDTKVEPVDVKTGGAHGLLWAFDSLYVMNNEAQGGQRGLYRVRDTDGDDALDSLELLRPINGGGEHGPHAIVLSPDGKSLYVVAGNATELPAVDSSLVPRLWGEDNLIPRLPDGAGFMTNEKAPGGWVCKVSPDGKTWELVSMGYRNPYDIAFNRDGELFTYDSDMEWDMNLPWYRPTRVCHVTSGADFGYRNGSGKWPTYYLDSLPPVVEIGPGSPTGITFGYGAKFPAKYQDALFVSDWSYGKLYALHLKPQGSSYKADLEEFVAGSPLPLTDLTVNPHDGALYFAVGGRRTSSGLYRLVYDGGEPTTPSTGTPTAGREERDLRHTIEAFHGRKDPKARNAVWPYKGHPDRFIAYAARVAIEFQEVQEVANRALYVSDARNGLPALLALIRMTASDPAHRRPGDPAPDEGMKRGIGMALRNVSKSAGSDPALLLDLARVYEVYFNRYGQPLRRSQTGPAYWAFDDHFPSTSRDLNSEVAQIAVFLERPDAAAKVVGLLASAPTQEEQIDYAKTLRVLKSGWKPELRMAYFAWFLKAAGYKGGNSFRGFMRQIKDAALANLSESDKASLAPILEAVPPSSALLKPAAAARPFVKSWTLDELVTLVESGLKSRDYERGHALFAAANCFACHRFNNEGGGAGPELTGLAGRFTARDVLTSILLPSQVISDQYAAIMVATTDGKVVTGRVMNLHDDSMMISTNMLDPNLIATVDRRKIEEIKSSPVSMMPEGLLNTLNRDEVLDLMAYLLSRGDRKADVFKKAE